MFSFLKRFELMNILTGKRFLSNLNKVEETKLILKNAQAVCFDVDSTVISDEGIDVLAASKGVGDAVAEMTRM
jgi:phosphoserine phosphatase